MAVISRDDERPPSSGRPAPPAGGNRTGAYVLAGLLLAAPFVAMLWVSSYAKAEPRLFGFPFFYWYQLLWVPIAAALTYAAYVIVRRVEPRRERIQDDREDVR